MDSRREPVRLLAILIIALFSACAGPAQAQLRADYRRALAYADGAEQTVRDPGGFVGLAMALVVNGQIAVVRGYGYRDIVTRQPVDADTVFRLASLSKGFAGAMAALEVHEGRLDLSDPVKRFVPAFALRSVRDTAAVTLEDVLSHRVGLPPYAYDNLLEAGEAPLKILSAYRAVDLICRPGACYAYQNSTFNMIADAIEAVSGQAYAERVAQKILSPLGMTRTGFGAEDLRASGNWAAPHVRRGGEWRVTPVKDSYYKLPAAGGMNASIRDMARWLEAQLGGAPTVLPAEALANMRTARIRTPRDMRRSSGSLPPQSESSYGLGWRLSSVAGETVVSHSGSVEGYFANITLLPERRSGIVILANARSDHVQNLVTGWLTMELGGASAGLVARHTTAR
jgi:beta-lactamase class C